MALSPLLLLTCGLHATTGLVALAGSHARGCGALRPLETGLRLQSPVQCGLFDMFKESDASKARLRLRLRRLPFPARVQHTFRRSRASPFGRARSSQLDRLPTPNLTLTLTLPGDRGSSLPAACRYGAGCGAGDGRQGGRAASH